MVIVDSFMEIKNVLSVFFLGGVEKHQRRVAGGHSISESERR